MAKVKNSPIAVADMSKYRDSQNLIDILNSTTVGELNIKIDDINTKQESLANDLADINNKISSMQMKNRWDRLDI